MAVLSVLGRRPDFRRVWIAEVVSDIGNFITFIAVGILVHDLTGKAFAVGLAYALRGVPWFTIGPIAGVIVDRVDRRLAMVVADVARAGLVVALAFSNDVWQVYLIAFLSGCLGPFFRPARQALLPVIAPGDDYVKALALSELAHQSLHTVGPAIGGAVVLLAGTRGAFLVDAVTFLLSAALVVGVTARGAAGGRPTLADVRTDLVEGGRTLWRDKVMRSLVASGSAQVLGGAAVTALMVAYIRDVLRDGAGEYGLALGVAGVGTVGMSLLLARGGGRVRRTPWLVLAAASPMLFLAVATSPSLPLLLGIMFVQGVAVAGLVIYDNAIIAERTPDRMRGRVFSLTGATAEAADVTGALALTALGDAIGIAPAIAISGALAAVLSVAFMAPAVGELREADEVRRSESVGSGETKVSDEDPKEPS
jgi:MFS family permease